MSLSTANHSLPGLLLKVILSRNVVRVMAGGTRDNRTSKSRVSGARFRATGSWSVADYLGSFELLLGTTLTLRFLIGKIASAPLVRGT